MATSVLARICGACTHPDVHNRLPDRWIIDVGHGCSGIKRKKCHLFGRPVCNLLAGVCNNLRINSLQPVRTDLGSRVDVARARRAVEQKVSPGLVHLPVSTPPQLGFTLFGMWQPLHSLQAVHPNIVNGLPRDQPAPRVPFDRCQIALTYRGDRGLRPCACVWSGLCCESSVRTRTLSRLAWQRLTPAALGGAVVPGSYIQVESADLGRRRARSNGVACGFVLTEFVSAISLASPMLTLAPRLLLVATPGLRPTARRYTELVYKRHRAVTKKLKKIADIEEKTKASGARVDNDQLVSLPPTSPSRPPSPPSTLFSHVLSLPPFSPPAVAHPTPGGTLQEARTVGPAQGV